MAWFLGHDDAVVTGEERTVRVRTVGLVFGVVGSLAFAGGAQASGQVHGLQLLKVHTSKRQVCRKAVINGMNNRGTVIGTTFCGATRTFVRTKSGHTRFYALPKADAKITTGANIASNGILAVDGQRKADGRVTGYLVRTGGQVTVLRDPLAGAHSTIVNGVNRHGAAVGEYCLNHKCTKLAGFLYRHGVFTNFTLPKLKQLLPSPNEITDSGAVIGSFYQYPSGYQRGFVRAHGKTRVIDAPHAGMKFGRGTVLEAASQHGSVCGVVLGAHHDVGFVRRNGHNHEIDLKPHVKHGFSEVTACADTGKIAVHVRLKHGAATYTGRIG
jgi:hypothetical protein